MSLFGGRYQSPQKSDGTVNSGGKVYFYITGTSTLKDVYTDEALTTAHANPVILDSAGSATIFLGTGSYDWKVDDSDDAAVVALQGPISETNIVTNILTIGTTWTVDGLGLTETTFTTLTLAMAEARKYIIMGGGGLTININNGTYTDDYPDFTHHNSRYISIIGASESGVIFDRSAAAAHTFYINNTDLGALENMTITNSHSLYSCVYVDKSIVTMDNITLDGEGTGGDCMRVQGVSSIVYAENLTCGGWTSSALNLQDSTVVLYSSFTADNSSNAAAAAGIVVDGHTAVLKNSGVISVVGHSSTNLSVGLWARQGGLIDAGTITNITDSTKGIEVSNHGKVITSTVNFSGVTTNYTPAVTDRWDNIATDTSLNFIAT